METLIKIARYTGEKKYLEPIPRALAYFKKCLLPDGRVARYYELKTNKPLYMDARVPAHLRRLGRPGPLRLEAARPLRRRSRRRTRRRRRRATRRRPGPAEGTGGPDVRRIIRELDAEGRWVTTYAGERLVGQPKFDRGFRYISSDVFSRNVETLSDWLSAAK